jgi:hypothetical protein
MRSRVAAIASCASVTLRGDAGARGAACFPPCRTGARGAVSLRLPAERGAVALPLAEARGATLLPLAERGATSLA